MDIERFHNELAMRLGYQRILNESITIQETDDPIVSLKVPGCDEISFKASEGLEAMNAQIFPEVKEIIDIVYQTYLETINCRF